MKHLIYIFTLLVTSFVFSQNTGMVVGQIMDNELNDTPLVLAKAALKDTNVAVDTDLTGMFVIENLEAGDYTLVCSFVGYETKEINIHVDANVPTELKLALEATTISLADLASLTEVAQKTDKTTAVLN
ncbi:carboxypeptidase-like regulatory domain-containing protein [Siansivirga zeaxanthinifaciens]|uniref:TonB-dependent receptor n=1 Tax=Siansivirga zeaxanthinifaciens CC-SAMT-1 TaxID=1454006 RepID=A0A0C5VUW6_9FLAO|nr:carboxypeptidase-like regulatory domain-containing protein [Siansivirga zeaxanthinifaciens]AJR02936.1 TonB-dependent receptor [Siansivirga zeaxanthinifaciens CC-SAMT-1]